MKCIFRNTPCLLLLSMLLCCPTICYAQADSIATDSLSTGKIATGDSVAVVTAQDSIDVVTVESADVAAGDSLLADSKMETGGNRSLITFYDDNTKQVGRTPSSANVSPLGGAVYTVPIAVPEDENLLKPSMALTYNSQSGNGILGFGFSLTGLSVITRGAKTIYHDDVADGLNYNNYDAFYLDGKRLIRYSIAEGVEGAVYTPEGDALTKVTMHIGTNGLWFEVTTTDGMRYEYGNTSQTCQSFTRNNTTVINAWYLNKAEDARGQTINYSYSKISNFLYPLSVTFGSVSSIIFEYESRTDKQYFVLGTTQGSMSLRLKKIYSSSCGEILRQYELGYTNDNFSRLTSVTEQDGSGTSLHPILINWNEISSFSPSVTAKSVNLATNNSNTGILDKYFMAGDVTGNGFSDLIQLSSVKAYNYNYGSSASWTYKTYVYIYKNTNNAFASTPLRCSFSGKYQIDDWVSTIGHPSACDMDGDGINDLIVPNIRDSDGAFKGFDIEYILGKNIAINDYAISCNYVGISNNPGFYETADFDNDGRSEFFVIDKYATAGVYNCYLVKYNGTYPLFSKYNISVALSGAPRRLFCSDFNQDGMTDVMIVTDTDYKILWNNGGALSNITFANYDSTTQTNVHNYTTLEIGDFNGDGLADFIMNASGSQSWFFAFGNGDGTFKTSFACYVNEYSGNTSAKKGGCYVFDFNHDGKTDVVLNYPFSLSTTVWLRSTGSSLVLHKKATSTKYDDGLGQNMFVGDFRGLGYAELMNYGNDCYYGNNANGSAAFRQYQSGDASSGKVSAVRGNSGDITNFTYSSLTDTNIYTKGTGSLYPIADIVVPLCVVNTIQRTGANVSDTESYTYGKLKVQLQGRGLLGFQETSMQQSGGQKVETTYSNWNNTFYVPTVTTVTRTQAGYTSSTVNTQTLANIGSNYVLYPSQQVDTDIYDNLTTTTWTFNQTLGNLLTQRTEYGSSNMYRQTSYSDYINIGRAYRAQTITTSQKHEDDPAVFSQTTKFTYNTKGLPATKIDYYGTDKQLNHTYTYNNLGRLLTETVSGDDIPTVTHQYTYGSYDKLASVATSPTTITTRYTYNDCGLLKETWDATEYFNQVRLEYNDINGLGQTTGISRLGSSDISIQRGWGNNSQQKYYVLEMSQGHPWKRTWYDNSGLETLTETVGAGGVAITTATAYNSKGLATSRTVTEGTLQTTEQMTYDGLNRLTAKSFSTGGAVQYSYGNRTMTTTDNGRTITKTYDAWGNVKTITDPVASVTYTYGSNGKPKSVTSTGTNANSTVSMTYDAAGNQTSLTDPDAGTMTYVYDELGRLTSQTDARNVETSFTYDAANRITQKVTGTTTYSYTYGTTGNATNCLTSIQSGSNSINYTYDSSRRVISETRTLTGESPLTFQYTYDGDNLASTTFPNGFTPVSEHDGFGYLQNVHKQDMTNIWYLYSNNGQNSTVKMGGTVATAADPNQNNTAMQSDPIYNYYSQSYFSLTNPVMSQVEQHDSYGFPQLFVLNRGNTTVSMFYYSFNPLTGNLQSRSGMLGQQESFTYDNLDRLTGVTLGNNQQTSISYDHNGNISSKTGLGNYHYPTGTVRPHAVTSVDNTDGLMSSSSQQITYNDLGKVASISDGSYTMEFTYGPDEQRWKTVLKQNNTVIRTILYAGNYERVTAGTTTRHFCYLDGGAIYMSEGSNTSGTVYYPVTDHLGSITKLVDLSGNIVFRASYDAWGKQTITTNTINFHRGYTGHEMLPEFGLINMNGRLYDPLLGRFLSPDNYVQMPDFSQSFNRYSYCLNNPLKYTDPSGQLFGIDDAIIAFAIFNMATSMIHASFSGENIWKAGGISLLSSVASYGIGSVFGGIGNLGHEMLRAGAHGLVSGGIGALNGGNFGSAFISGALASGIGSFAQGVHMNPSLMVASTSAMGGIGAWLTGESAMQGVMNGLSIGILNHAMHDGGITYSRDANGNWNGAIPEVVVTPEHNTWGTVVAGMGINALSFGFGGYASSRYYKSAFGSEVWRTSSGKVYSSSILERQANGKYVRGVQGIRISKELAKKSIKMPNFVGKTLGRLSIGITIGDAISNPIPENVFTMMRSVASYFSIPYAALDIYATCSYYDIQNAVDCRHGFAGTYASAASGSYAIPW